MGVFYISVEKWPQLNRVSHKVGASEKLARLVAGVFEHEYPRDHSPTTLRLIVSTADEKQSLIKFGEKSDMAIDNDKVGAALIMDRSKAIGNSEGLDDRGRLHVKVSNKDSEPIPVILTDTEPGEPYFADFEDMVTTNAPETLLDITVSALNKLFLSQVEISCRIESKITIEKNGVVIGSLRTGASTPSVRFTWLPRRQCNGGDNIKVILQKRAGSPDIGVGAHLMGLTQTT